MRPPARPHVHRLAVLALAMGSIIACSDLGGPAAPAAARTPLDAKLPVTDSLLAAIAGLTSGDSVDLMQRTVPLASPISASAVIGPAGGELRLDAAGAVVTFPRGALNVATTITMTALPGSGIAYELEPHGTVFNRPVVIQQDLRGTVAWTDRSLLDLARGGYFDSADDSTIAAAAQTKARVNEVEFGYVDLVGHNLRFFVGHFSGYLVSSGHKDTQ